MAGPLTAQFNPWNPELLRRSIADRGEALVALSGGVDSSVVAALAADALGERATAATLVSSAVSADELDRARRVAALLEIRHVMIPIDPLANEGYRSNSPSRCYFCRTTESTALRGWGASHGVRQYLDGIHRDDLGDDRPGIRAMDEAGFRHPLLEAGWGKERVRAYAQELGLPNWNEPSEACLASRVPHGRAITTELLERVGAAEAATRTFGFRRVRVRIQGSGARVVVDREETARLLVEPTATAVRHAIEALGFAPVELDADGYRPRPNG